MDCHKKKEFYQFILCCIYEFSFCCYFNCLHFGFLWCKLVSKSIFKVLHFVVACKVFLIAFHLLLSCYKKNFRRLNGLSDHIHVNDIRSVTDCVFTCLFLSQSRSFLLKTKVQHCRFPMDWSSPSSSNLHSVLFRQVNKSS